MARRSGMIRSGDAANPRCRRREARSDKAERFLRGDAAPRIFGSGEMQIAAAVRKKPLGRNRSRMLRYGD
jgi:hypothetical protein